MAHDNFTLQVRYQHLIDRGVINAAFNKQVKCEFASIPMTRYFYGCCVQQTKHVYVNDALRWCPWFAIDEVLVHEGAHISKGYAYGFDDENSDTHGPEFRQFNHISVPSLRRGILLPLYFIGYLIKAIIGD